MIVRSITKDITSDVVGGIFGSTPAIPRASVWFDHSDISTLFQDSARSTPVTADTEPIGGITDNSGFGNHGSSAGGDRPLYDVGGDDVNAVEYVSDDYIEVTQSNFTSDMYLALAVKTTDATFILLAGAITSAYIICGVDASADTNVFGGVGSPTLKVDGVTFSGSRDDLHTIISDGAWHIVELVGADLSSVNWDTFKIGQYAVPSFSLEGNIFGFVAIDAATAAEQANAYQWFEENLGL